MGRGRLEAFSDGVLAIIITIMVLELKVPHGNDLEALRPLLPVFLSYLLSFVYIGIYWNNHHHMLHTVQHVNGKVLWANIHLLFWLSLVPLQPHGQGKTIFAMADGVVWFCAAYVRGCILHFSAVIDKAAWEKSTISIALGNDVKGKISVAIYSVAIALAFVNSWISLALYALVAIMWFIPDSRIEKVIENGAG